jgi:hypothetical protein
LPQRCVLVDDPCFVEGTLHFEDGLLRRLEDSLEATQYRHRKDHIAVFAAKVKVSEDVVSDVSDQADDAAVRGEVLTHNTIVAPKAYAYQRP